MPDATLRERIHLPSLGLAAAFALLVLVAVVGSDGAVSPLVLLTGVLGTAYLLAASLDAVRAHDLFELTRATVLAVLLGLWWLSLGEKALLPGVLVALGVLAVAIELYNYVYDTSYLRIDA